MHLGRSGQIPLGQYGSQTLLKRKLSTDEVLATAMGADADISGIHHNFLCPTNCRRWVIGSAKPNRRILWDDRNFRRWSWLLLYRLARPCGMPILRVNTITALSNLTRTFYLPHATSLRMGRLGYQSKAQSALDVSYNSVADYSRSMRIGLTESFPDYAAILPGKDQQRPQLNDAVLQIENEFYGTIRPKRTTRSGERPLAALNERGVEYVEVRCVDLNPFEPLGINAEQIRFLDTFLLLCLLAPRPLTRRFARRLGEIKPGGRARPKARPQLETDTGLVALSVGDPTTGCMRTHHSSP